MKTARFASVFSLVFICIFAPLSFPRIVALSQSVPVEEITGYQEWNESRTIDSDVIVGPDATLVIGKGVELNITKPAANLYIEGTLIVKGTVKNPVSIKALPEQAGFAIITAVGSRTTIRNAEITNGGTQAFQVKGPYQNTAIAASYQGAIQVSGGEVDIQNTTFKNNLFAIVVGSSAASARVNRSRFIDNEFDVDVEADENKVDFRYNWWGTPDGPQQACYDYPNLHYCYYEKIGGTFDFSDWLTQETFLDPVLIVPGILGSQKKNDTLVVDPVYHTYDNLYDAFIDNGYTPGINLFLFPYEWRDSNIENARRMQEKIDEIKQSANWPKVDIVAHSMGGLLAREYVEADYYGNDVDQLITLGTPHLGAPEAYIKWDGASWFFSPLDLYMKHVVSQEAEEAGFSDIFDYIHDRPMASIQELLPIYDYLYDLDQDGALRTYPTNYPRNQFLENLHERSGNLNNVEFDKIIGNLGNDSSTISGFNVINVDMGKYWAHGYLPGFEVLSERGIRYSNGDSTVPLYSAKSESLKSDNLIELTSDHRSIVTDAQRDVLELLTNHRPEEEVRRSLIHRILFVSVHSPVDIQVVSPSGKKMGKNFETGGYYDEIDGAYYTGFDTENEFITIPNPEKGEYKVLTQGTGTGDYRVEAAHIEEIAGGQGKESVATIAGVAETGVETESLMELKETGEVVAEGNQDTTPPVTTAAVAGTAGTSGWYTSDVVVTFAAADEENGSGVEKTEYSLDNGATWSVYSVPISLTQEGATTLQYFSTDKADNQETAKSETIKIDKTAPEGKITLNPTTRKLEITGTDSMGGAVSVALIELPVVFVGPRLKDHDRSHEEHRGKKRFQARLTDEAGHVTSIAFLREKQEKNELAFKVQSVAYDAVEMTVMKTAAQYEWQKNGKKPYQKLEAELRTATERLESRYMPKKNETWIKERTKDDDDDDEKNEHDSQWQKLPGLVVPYLETAEGLVQGKY